MCRCSPRSADPSSSGSPARYDRCTSLPAKTPSYKANPATTSTSSPADRLEVLVDDQHIREHHTGDAFGEIALLRDVPRTATVRALEDTELQALGRDDFLAAITGHADTARAAHAIATSRLNRAQPVARLR